ncbi:hypothetical protein BDV33DRAFT_163956 [Aspergillus novoparasiticus]|uniref:Uncharacterized protein n=1 Tax=Aspergillus novoparasiticus TaxID=986946 RepID=A0A5N6F5V4_9EURO|nr:hypothetical protein BDV33DRAFT_163956 [Aspergillus novoparasiticus]
MARSPDMFIDTHSVHQRRRLPMSLFVIIHLVRVLLGTYIVDCTQGKRPFELWPPNFRPKAFQKQSPGKG